MAVTRVLAADDDECNLDILRRMLLRLGAEVQTARDGAEAARLALGEAAAGRPSPDLSPGGRGANGVPRR